MTILTVKAQIETPRVPNFLRMTDGHMLPVSAVTEDGLKEIGLAWTIALIENAKRQCESGYAGDERK